VSSQPLPTPYSGKLHGQNLQTRNMNWTPHHDDIPWVEIQAFLTSALDGGELSVSRCDYISLIRAICPAQGLSTPTRASEVQKLLRSSLRNVLRSLTLSPQLPRNTTKMPILNDTATSSECGWFYVALCTQWRKWKHRKCIILATSISFLIIFQEFIHHPASRTMASYSRGNKEHV